jgi:urease accessory protein
MAIMATTMDSLTATAMTMTMTIVTVTSKASQTHTRCMAHTPSDMQAPLLPLLWLASPALPIGAFSYSEVLEAAVEHDLVCDEHGTAEWLSDQLHLSQARGDMALVAKALAAWTNNDTEQLHTLNRWVLMTRESAELRLQSEQMGRSLLEWMRNLNMGSAAQLDLCSQLQPTYPIVMALALHCTGAQHTQALQAYAFGWAENMVQAAVKVVPLGQSAGQRVLARLAQEIPQAVAHAMALPNEERQSFTPRFAILSARHEHQYSRLFRS